MPSGLYDADGKIRLTQSPGSGFCGRYAPDGSIYFTTAPGSGFCGSTAPDGSLYIVDATGSSTLGVYAPNGAIRVTTGNEYNGAWRVSGVSSVVASWDASTSTLALLAAITTHSRTSLATMFDSTGKNTFCPNNLLLNTATLGTQTVTVQVGVNYILSIKGTGSVTLTGASTAGPLNGTGASNRVDLKITAATSSLTLTVSGSVTSARLSAVTYETAFRAVDDVDNTASAYYGPRIDYDPNTLAVKGLLIEPLPSTNYCPNSSTLTAWSATGGTLTNNSGGTLDPSGLNTASILNPSGGTTAGALTSNITTSVSTEYTASCFVKSNGSNFAGIGFYDATNALLYASIYNLTTGANTFTTGGVTPLTSENIGNGWWRISAKWTTASNTVAVTPIIYTYSSGGGGNPVASDKIYFWGPQYEKNFEAATYIPNQSTGTTARAGDNAQFIGSAASAMSASTFSVIAEARLKTANAAGVILIGADTAFGIPLYTTSATTVRAYDSVRASVYGDVNTGGASWLAGSRTGVSVSPSGTTLAMDGGAISSYTNFAGIPTGGALGRFTNFAANPGTIWVKSFAIYNQRLPDATLQTKSVVGASY